MTEPRIHIPTLAIEDFCRRWKISEFSLFGSVLREDFRPDSDVDFLVSFHEGAKPGWPAIVDLHDELSALLQRPVQVVERPAVEAAENYIKRRHILATAEPVYVEG